MKGSKKSTKILKKTVELAKAVKGKKNKSV